MTQSGTWRVVTPGTPGLRGRLHGHAVAEGLELADEVALARIRVVATSEVVIAEVLLVTVV
ncbi:MAG: hypothetical protein ACRDJ2_08760 [Actinomycetota bacterium]